MLTSCFGHTCQEPSLCWGCRLCSPYSFYIKPIQISLKIYRHKDVECHGCRLHIYIRLSLITPGVHWRFDIRCGCIVKLVGILFRFVFLAKISVSGCHKRHVQHSGHRRNSLPVLFIPGNAGSSHQVRSIASSATRQYYSSPYIISPAFEKSQIKPLDFFAGMKLSAS